MSYVDKTSNELANYIKNSGKDSVNVTVVRDESELDITINELISGERIEKEQYQEKFEENIINTIDYTNKKINRAYISKKFKDQSLINSLKQRHITIDFVDDLILNKK